MTLRRKYILIILPLLVLPVSITFTLKSCSPMYHGAVSDHFDGTSFFSEESDHSFFDELKWWWEMETVDWPEWVNDPPQPGPVSFVKGTGLRVTYVNHATMLIQTDSVNILTDPIWSERASPVSWAGTKRVRAPGVRMEDLPRIDLILISHDHYDHLDLPTLKQLAALYQPQILVGLGVDRLLESEGISNVTAMDWWEEHQLKPANLKITFVPACHSSGRFLWGNNRTLWGGFVIESSGGRIYFAGDTGSGKFLDLIKERFPDFRLTILPLGNYEKRWIMKSQHMNPEDAVNVHLMLNSKQSVAMHFGTFLEHAEQTIDAHEHDLAAALQNHNVPESEFWILQFGEGRDVSQ